MKKRVLVSVLMTAFNREKYIAEAIRSVLASSLSDFELIIVDDCSSDATVEIAREYECQDHRVKLFINDRNLGDYPNRNKAASYASGKYLKYLDSDDMMSPTCLERMVSEMERCPDAAFGIISRSETKVNVFQPENAFRTHFFDRGILDVGPSATIIKNDVFIKENGFWELRCVSDFELWMRLALLYPMIELEKDLVFWREHDQQEIRFNSHTIQTLEYSLSIIKDKLNASQLMVSEKKSVVNKLKRGMIRYLIRNIFKVGLVRSYKLKSINELKFSDAF